MKVYDNLICCLLDIIDVILSLRVMLSFLLFFLVFFMLGEIEGMYCKLNDGNNYCMYVV